jgi:hypothetical protein
LGGGWDVANDFAQLPPDQALDGFTSRSQTP